MTHLPDMTKEELRDARERLGQTQRQLAAALGISLSQLRNYERGVARQSGRPAPIPTAIELAIRYLLIEANAGQEGKHK